MPIVWLIRHGESQSNIGELTYSSKEARLTDLGHKQAQEIVQAFNLHSPSRVPSLIITSEYIRSQQTANPTLVAFPQSRKEQWLVHEFTYLSDKKTLWTKREERCEFVEQFWDNDDPEYFDGEGAETFTQFIKRVYDVIECLRYSKEDFITVYTHGRFIQAMLWILNTAHLRIDFDSKLAFRHFCWEHPIPTGAIQEIEFCGREEFHFGKLITDHLSSINFYPSCSDINTALPELNTSHNCCA